MFAMNHLLLDTTLNKWSQWARNSGSWSPSPPPRAILRRDDGLIENADSWRKIRKTAAIYREYPPGMSVFQGPSRLARTIRDCRRLTFPGHFNRSLWPGDDKGAEHSHAVRIISWY
jgi:hypothetical protein